MKKKMMKRFKNERGLTLVELLAVVVILGIIGTIAFVMIGNTIDNSKKDAHVANAQQLISAAKLYEASEGEEIGEGDSEVTSSELESSGYLEPLINPWDKEDYEDEGTVTKSDEGYKVSLSGDKCEIDDATEEEVLKGREEVCDKD